MKASLLPLLLLGLSAAPGALAQAPTARAPAAPQWHDIPGVSPAGNAILKKAQSAPDPQLAQAITRMRALNDQMAPVLMAPTIDVDKVAALLKQRDDINNTVRTSQTNRVVAALRQLSPADRGPFLRALAGPPPGASAPR